jgi:WD40 repeat protein
LTDICWLDKETILTTGEDSSLRVWTFSGHQPGLPNRPIGEDRNKTGVDDVQGPPASEVPLARTLHQHVGPVLGVCVLDGVESAQPLAASWGQDRTVRIWQPLTGRMVRFIRLAATPRCIAWNAETQQLVAGDQAGQLHWLDWKTGSIIRSIGVDDDWLTVVLFDREGQRILVGTSGGNLQFVFSAN